MRQTTHFASFSTEYVLVCRSSCIMQAAQKPVVAYAFAFLTLLLHAADTTIQWRTNPKSKRCLSVRIIILLLILSVEIGLCCYIELERSRQRMEYLPALWGLMELSTLLGLSIEGRFPPAENDDR